MSRAHWRPVYLALGSNLDDPVAQLRRGIASLEAVDGLRIYRVSSFVQSPPADGSDQPDYINAVVAGMTVLTSQDLLTACRSIESEQGRDPSAPRWSARTLDIDILAVGQEQSDEPALTLPHPRLAERAFVLQPLAEIAPTLRIPGIGRVAVLAQALGAAALPIVHARRATGEGSAPIRRAS